VAFYSLNGREIANRPIEKTMAPTKSVHDVANLMR
jgi:hypothetical protein